MSGVKLPHKHSDVEYDEVLVRQIEKTEQFQAAGDIFKLLSDSSRVRIYWLLCHCEECVINISAFVGMSSPAVSHHLKLLKDGGLVESRRVGKEVYYRAKNDAEGELLHRTIESCMLFSCNNQKRSIDKCCEASSDETINKVHEYLLENLDKRITIDDLSKRFLLNSTSLKVSFKREYGKSVAAHIKEHRMSRASELLLNGQMSVGEIARAVGYESVSKFSAAFRTEYGVSPTEYRKKK